MEHDEPDWLKEFEVRFDEAMAQSDALGDGVHEGKIFAVRVPDGCAYYQVVRVNKKTARITWRKDLTLDAYKDAVLQDGGSFDIGRIRAIVRLGEYWRRLRREKR
ncbi:MAG: hypothetical protein IH624_14395 [Phycisphaerae bacterium]|nr:hypothetical protein [Phycisphaerae bacterium]